MRRFAVLALVLALSPLVAAEGFKPVFEGADLTARTVRPGGSLSILSRFRNAGDAPAPADYRVFLHFEDPIKGCAALFVNLDHYPAEPTTGWEAGATVLDGPLSFTVPATLPPGTYQLHTGLYGDEGRVLDVVIGQVTLDPNAADTTPRGPEPLAAAEVARRKAALVSRLKQPAELSGEGFRFAIDPATGAWVLTDTRTNVAWTSSPTVDRFGRVFLARQGQAVAVALRELTVAERGPGRLVLARPLPLRDGSASGLTFRLVFTADPRPPGGLLIAWETQGTSPWQVARVTLLDRALPVTEAEGGRTVEPVRLGRALTAATDQPDQHHALTYAGATMQMISLEHDGSALLVSWDDVDVAWQTQLLWLDHPAVPGRRVILHSFDLTNQARRLALRPVGAGTYVAAARAYRPVAERQGWRVTRGEQAKTRPNVMAMAGAADFKPFVFSRSLPSSRYNSSGKESTSLGFTFAQTGQLADHWRHDLELDKAMVVLAGWINRGYDNRHPDILPAAPECGGNEALAAASAKIRGDGYLFGLHDNYQDMYEDAPSFSAAVLRKDRQGKPMMGGNWAGGQAWQVRPQDQLKLAEHNLPEVKRLFSPTAYFIDTVFAWPLVDSDAPGDAWGHAVDLEYKSRLCRYAREQMGVFGSEEGREWAVPVADYLEGLLGHKYDTAPGQVRPIFLLAYHDCVNTYTHQSTRIGPDDDAHVLDTLIYAEMPVYGFGSGLYWQRDGTDDLPLRVRAEVEPAGGRNLKVTYLWESTAPLRDVPQASTFVHFTNDRFEREGIAFQDDHALPVALSSLKPGQVFRDGPRTVTVPAGADGEFRLQLGLLSKGERLSLSQGDGRNGRYWIGTVRVGQQGITYEPHAARGRTRPFARPEGWARSLGATDRFIKNTYEVLSWTHRLTFGVPFEDHQVADGVERTRFGSDLRIVANYGEAPVDVPTGGVLGTVTLPQYGFVVWSPGFVAVHATAVDGHRYDSPVLFTARSLDGKPLAGNARVRLYHGFGGPELGLAGRRFSVDREAVVALR